MNVINSREDVYMFLRRVQLTGKQEIKLPPGKFQLLAACSLLCHAALIHSLSVPGLHTDKAWLSVTNTTGEGRSRLTLICVPKAADGV